MSGKLDALPGRQVREHLTPGVFELRYSDYGDLDGRMLPRKSVMTFEGQKFATVTVDALEVNPELDPSLFEITTE